MKKKKASPGSNAVEQNQNAPSKFWYAVYTRPRHEKQVAGKFGDQQFEHYLPLIREVHKWADRRKWVEVPLIRGYVFVRIESRHMLYIFETAGVVRVVTFNHEYAIIPDFQINALRQVLETGMLLSPVRFMQVGQLVEVLDGPLKGVVGRIQNFANQEKFVISLDAVQASYSVVVDKTLLKPISDQKKKKMITMPLGF